MYISKPLPFNLSKIVYEWNPYIYPFIIMILEITVPFFTTYGIYQLINQFQAKHNFENENVKI